MIYVLQDGQLIEEQATHDDLIVCWMASMRRFGAYRPVSNVLLHEAWRLNAPAPNKLVHYNHVADCVRLGAKRGSRVPRAAHRRSLPPSADNDQSPG